MRHHTCDIAPPPAALASAAPICEDATKNPMTFAILLPRTCQPFQNTTLHHILGDNQKERELSDKAVQQIADKFGLERDNFILDPIVDFDCFARDDIAVQEIAEGLDIDLVTGLAPKRLVWGPYGGGKTHMLMKTTSELGKLTDVTPIRIECPDLNRKSRFHDLYREGIMRGLGESFVIGLMEEVVQNVGFRRADELRAELKNWFGDEEVGKAAEQLFNPQFERLKLWRWISGVSMSRADLDQLGQTQDLTQAEAARLADLIVMLGKLLKRLKNHTLVLILDEMERLRTIGPETITTFMSGFSHLVDQNQRSVSILIGSSAALEAEMVDIFTSNSPVMSRLGDDVKIEISALSTDQDVDRFVERVLQFVRKTDFDIAASIASLNLNGETVQPNFYPFSNEALEAVKAKLTSLTPRAIAMQMTRALGRAHRKDLCVITADCVL